MKGIRRANGERGIWLESFYAGLLASAPKLYAGLVAVTPPGVQTPSGYGGERGI